MAKILYILMIFSIKTLLNAKIFIIFTSFRIVTQLDYLLKFST